MRAVRVLGVALALAGCAWFIVGIQQANDTADASALVSGPAPLSAARAAHARALLHSAGQLNPDTQVDLLRAQFDRDQGDYGAARVVIRSVLRAEPQNAQAWLALAHSANGNRQIFYTALIHIRALVPPVPPPR